LRSGLAALKQKTEAGRKKRWAHDKRRTARIEGEKNLKSDVGPVVLR
jgi:hypothetical protein